MNFGYIRNVGVGNETTSVPHRGSLFTENSVKPYTEGNFSKVEILMLLNGIMLQWGNLILPIC